MNRLNLSLIAVLGVVAGAATASADNLTYTGLTFNNTVTGNVTFLDSSNQSHTEDVYIGLLQFNDATTHSTINTVCADISSLLDGGSHGYNLSSTDPSMDTAISHAGRIVSANFASVHNAQDGAALQIAVWAALYNGPVFSANTAAFGVSGVDSSILAKANSDFSAYYNEYGTANFYQTSAGGGQSQMNAAPVPEPASMGALVVGAIGLLRRRRSA